MRTPPRGARARPARASGRSASSSWQPRIPPLGTGRCREGQRGSDHGATIPSGAGPGKNGGYRKKQRARGRPRARRAAAPLRSETEAETRRDDVGVPRVTRARRRVREGIHARTHEHVATRIVPGDPRGEPPGDATEELSAEILVGFRRLRAREDRDEAIG